jgi:tRNA dimethylallyltransferase
MDIQNKKIIAIVGPTASGKTAVGVKLAKEFNGEIVSADSRQVFRCLDLGTGKDLSEYGNVKYHLIDICDPDENFTLQNYLEAARKAIDDIFSRGKTPIVVGGTGLYVQALVEGFHLSQKSKVKSQNCNSKLINDSKIQYRREQLERLTLEQLQNILKEIDPETFERIDQKNPRRLIRAIERTQENIQPAKNKPDFEVLQIALDFSREELFKRIDKRVEDRFEVGMLEEVVELIKRSVDTEWLIKLGLEYRIITDFIISKSKFLISNQTSKSQLQNVKSSKEFIEMKELLKVKSHQYAKRQLTWFRRFPEIVWESDYEKIGKLIKNFLN